MSEFQVGQAPGLVMDRSRVIPKESNGVPESSGRSRPPDGKSTCFRGSSRGAITRASALHEYSSMMPATLQASRRLGHRTGAGSRL